MAGKPVFEVPAKTVINFESGFQKKKLCDGPVFNAGQACVYKCAFCYVESMERKRRPWFKTHGVVYPPEGHLGIVIRNKDAVQRAQEQLLAHPQEERNKRKVIYSSTKVDVAGNMDLVRETVEICKVILELTNWDIRLLSKSNLLPKIAIGVGDSTECGARRRMIFGVSTGTLDDKLAAAFEEGTPKVSKRIESIHWLQDNGFRTFGMICPSLPQPHYRYFSETMAEALRIDRMEDVWAEVINVRGHSYTRTIECLEKAGFINQASLLNWANASKENWEAYARATFQAHTEFIPPHKLKFLQYVTKATEPWWKQHEHLGAVLL